MIYCKKCGTPLPDNAVFCGECGAKLENERLSPSAYRKAITEARRYKVISVILSLLCVIMGLGWVVTSHNAYDSIDNYEKEAVNMDRAGVELSGIYVVGEDSELPEGRYNIYPPDDESYMSVYIYENMEDAKKQYDEDDGSLAIDSIYSLTRGYKLKAGWVVSIDYDSAYFELVDGNQADTEESVEPDADASESE